jgi:hypothetical protein
MTNHNQDTEVLSDAIMPSQQQKIETLEHWLPRAEANTNFYSSFYEQSVYPVM